jgi:hypothetical protein
VFVVNSRLGLSSAASSGFGRFIPTPNEAPLLPKLRGHFAEFLNEGFPAHLRILSPPTCVGLRYGHPSVSLEAFLDSLGSVSSLARRLAPHHFSGSRMADFPAIHPTSLDANFHPRAYLPSCVTPSLNRLRVVLEFQPVVHRLRFSASA